MYAHLVNRVHSWILVGIFLLALSVSGLGYASLASHSAQDAPQRVMDLLSAGEHEPDFG